MSETQKLAEQIAAPKASASPLVNNVSIDPSLLVLVITALIQVIAQCFQQQPQTSTPKQYLEDHFDEVTGTFDAHLINRVRPQTRRACKQNNISAKGRVEIDEISTQTLLNAMKSDDATLQAILDENRP